MSKSAAKSHEVTGYFDQSHTAKKQTQLHSNTASNDTHLTTSNEESLIARKRVVTLCAVYVFSFILAVLILIS